MILMLLTIIGWLLVGVQLCIGADIWNLLFSSLCAVFTTTMMMAVR